MGVTIRKKNGKWYVFVNFHGKRKAKCVGTKEVALKIKRIIEAKLALGDMAIFADERDILTFGEYAERWLKEYAEMNLKRSTVASYRQLLRLYLVPLFGNIAINQITRESIKVFLADMAAKSRYGNEENPSPLSRNTLRLGLATLRVIMNHAVEDGLIDRNPAEKLGKLTKTERPKQEAAAMTRAEAECFLNATKEICEEQYPLFLTALRCGLRRGELVALQWGDVQFGANEGDNNRYILVQRNYVQGKFTSPKSKKSRRVDLSKQLRRVLLELRDKRLLEGFMAGKASILEELVFPSQAGTVMDPNNLNHYYFQPALEKAGLRKFRFHDLRHTFGSLLIQDGASLAYVKEQMGHSSIQVTADVYGHLVPGANISWVDRLDCEESAQPNATQTQPETEFLSGDSLYDAENNGERGRNRTYNLLIKSQLLCQLSYAPFNDLRSRNSLP